MRKGTITAQTHRPWGRYRITVLCRDINCLIFSMQSVSPEMGFDSYQNFEGPRQLLVFSESCLYVLVTLEAVLKQR